jgi:hypothetical protein
MMALVAAALVVCAVAVGALGYAVLTLSRQVHGLAERLVEQAPSAALGSPAGRAATRSVNEPPVAATETPPPAGALPSESVEPAEDERVDVTVITDLDDTADEVDLTASRVASVTLAGPLIKVAAFSHGVRQALDEESRMRIGYAVRKELKRQRKLRRRQRSRQPTSMGDRP